MTRLLFVTGADRFDRALAVQLGAATTCAFDIESVDPRHAIGAIRDGSPDVLIIDADDADERSWSLLTQLKTHPDPIVARTRVVMLGPPDDLTRIRAIIEGCLGYVPRPAETQYFHEQVDLALADLPEPALRATAQRKALQELAVLERRSAPGGRGQLAHTTAARPELLRSGSRTSGSASSMIDPRLPDQLLDRLSEGQRRVLFALSQTASIAESARHLGISPSRVSAQVTTIAKRLAVPREVVVARAQSGELLGAVEVARLRLSAELERAIASDELVLDYQPIVAIADRRVSRAEALLRWKHPRRGLMHPGEFLAAAEATGVIWPLTRWVLNDACTQARRWNHGLRPGEIHVTVNVSAHQVAQGDLVTAVKEALSASQLDPALLVLDIPASALATKPTRVSDVINRINGLGVKIAIDDFVGAHSSLRLFKQLPIDVLKIDRAVIAGLGRTSVDTAIVTASLALGVSLGIETQAEGVETQHQLDLLASLGCCYAQGHHLAPPMPAEDFSALLT